MPVSQLQGRVIIDAGHGGEDPGAIGHRGLKEKDVTLDIALRLRRLFRRYLPQVETVLTRAKDQAVSLEKRVLIANKKPADIFLSLHVNSSENKESNGFELYSLDIASDRHSERLAQRENRNLDGEENQVGFILADLRAFSNRKVSDRLAKFLEVGLDNQLKNKATLKNRGYHQAIFHVLFVKMPAVLAELFFISNPKEEQMLASKNAREAVARGIFVGLFGFLNEKNERAQHAKR